MKLPGQRSYAKEWQIGEETWELKFVPKLDFDGHGECDPETRELIIKQGQIRLEIMRTFFHEVGHGLEFSYDIELPHDVIYQYEEAWTNFFIDNWEQLAQLVLCSKVIK